MKKRLIALTLLLAIALTGCNKHTELKPTIAHEENKTTESMANVKPVTPTEEPTAAPSVENQTTGVENPTEVTIENGATEPATEWATENGTVEEPTGEVATENRTQAPTEQPTTTQTTTQSTTKVTQQQATQQATTKQPTTTQQQPTTQAPTQQPTTAFDEDGARRAVLAAMSDARRDLKGWGPVTLDREKSFDSDNRGQYMAGLADYYRDNEYVYNMYVATPNSKGRLFISSSFDYNEIYSFFYKGYMGLGDERISSDSQIFFYEDVTTVGIDIGKDSLGNYYIGLDGSYVSKEVAVQAVYDGLAAYRAEIGYNPFPLNEKLCAQAQKWADTVAANPEWYESGTKIVHSSQHEGYQLISCSETVSWVANTASGHWSDAHTMYSHCSAISRPDSKPQVLGVGITLVPGKNGAVAYVVMQFAWAEHPELR